MYKLEYTEHNKQHHMKAMLNSFYWSHCGFTDGLKIQHHVTILLRILAFKFLNSHMYKNE